MNRPKLVPLRPKHAKPPRGTTTQRGYGTAHQKARSRKLAEVPVCEMCGERFATDLHHLDGNAHNRYPANLQALCEDCHHREAHG